MKETSETIENAQFAAKSVNKMLVNSACIYLRYS